MQVLTHSLTHSLTDSLVVAYLLTHSLTYSATDIIQTLFRVTKSLEMPEYQKLEFIKEIGFSHMRIAEGLNTQLQLMGCISRLAILSEQYK